MERKLTRQQRRSMQKGTDKNMQHRMKELNRPAKMVELLSAMQASDEKFDIIMRFLHSKYGDEFEQFVNESVDDKIDEIQEEENE